MGESGPEKSSKVGAQPPGASADATSRPVFISYASADAALAQKVCATLEAAGILCWIAPRDVVPGTQYADGIVGAIDESRILVLIVSKDALASVHVGRELERAASKRHPVIALRVDTAPLTRAFEYFLNQSQWIEVGAGGVDGAVAKLVEAVGRHLAPGSVAGQSPGPHATITPHKAAMPRRVWGIAGVIVVFALVAAYFWLGKSGLHLQSPAAVAVVDKSIAVLPFTDMSEKKDQEYFADGMAEEIINLLVKVPALKVISPTSSFQFKGHADDLHTIGSELGVAYVLEGSVRQSGERLRVTAQLINTKDGRHLWSQSYDRDLSDVLKMQDEIAASIARALQIEVGYGLVTRPALRSTEAYTLYLQGWHAFNRYDQQGFEQAVSYLQRALELDPMLADAAAGLAIAYDNLGEYGYMPAPVAFEQARRAARLALKLDPNHAIAHAMLGNIHVVYDWDWQAGEAEFKLARDLAPNESVVLFFAGQQSLIVGRWDDALNLLNAALELDPLNPSFYFELYLLQLRRDRLAEAEAAIRRTLAISSTFSYAHYNLGIVSLIRGEPQSALTEMLKEPNDGSRLLGSALAYSALGRKDQSDAALAQLLKSQTSHPFNLAQVYAFRGESDQAFKWLDRAYAEKDAGLPFIKGEPLLKNVEGDPRYKAFLKKMNLPE